MKPELAIKYLSHLRSKKQNGEGGFTLIELLVVVIIIGVLAAVALPNLLNQVGKAREVEIKNAAGTVTRNQQAFHFERQVFASTVTDLGLENAFANSEYLDAAAPVTIAGGGSATGPATVVTKNPNFQTQGTRAYSGAIGFDTGTATYDQILCQTDGIAQDGIAPTDAATCAANSGEIK